MPRTDRWAERIGAVFLPEADTVEDRTPAAEGLPPLEQGCYTISLRWEAVDRYAPTGRPAQGVGVESWRHWRAATV
jgi:hypothetical protein